LSLKLIVDVSVVLVPLLHEQGVVKVLLGQPAAQVLEHEQPVATVR
jgi:hypothetical protein